MLKHVWRNRYIDHELFACQGRLLRNSIAEINIIIIGKNLSRGVEMLKSSGVVSIINEERQFLTLQLTFE